MTGMRVDWPHDFVGGRGEDREIEALVIVVVACVDAGHREGISIFHDEAIRLFAAGDSLPFIEAIRDDQAVSAGMG
jgi:hypothetical protein